MATKWLGQPQNIAGFGKYLSRVSHSGSKTSNITPSFSARSRPQLIQYPSSACNSNARSTISSHFRAPTLFKGASPTSLTTNSASSPHVSFPRETEGSKISTFTPNFERLPHKTVHYTRNLASTPSTSYRPPGSSSFRPGCSRSVQASPSGSNIMWSAQQWGDCDCPTRRSMASRRKSLWSAYESGIVMALEAAKVYEEPIDHKTEYGSAVLSGHSYLSSKLGAQKWEQRLQRSR